MVWNKSLDCVVVGYNEVPFPRWEEMLRQYGDDSEAYRDLKLSFVDLDGEKMTYADLLTYVLALAAGGSGGAETVIRSGDIPSLAAAYLVNFLQRRGLRSEYINLFQAEKDRLAALLDQDPLCVAITTTLYVINLPVHEIVEFIRERNPKVKIVVGGPLVANHARNHQGAALETALGDMGADIYVVEGQGEATLARIVECLRDGGDLGEVPNLVYRDHGRFQTTVALPENNPLDEGFIDWHALSSRNLGPTLQTRTARSCAFKCSFCNYPTRAGKLTLAGLDTLEKELDSMASRGNVKNVIFIDDTFNVPLPRFKDICRLMIRKNYGFNWFSYFRCGNSDEEAFDLMADSGCTGVFLGIESGSNRILKNMHKAAVVEQYRNGIGKLRDRGILTFGSFILGFPGETDETVHETESFIRSTGLDYYRTQLWYNEPGTPIHALKDQYQITGEGFVWSHATMDSMDAMDHIERLFLSIDEAIWLPQWSFDFWIIPDLLGKGISLAGFRSLMRLAHKMLALEVASISAGEKCRLQQSYLDEMVSLVRQWRKAA